MEGQDPKLREVADGSRNLAWWEAACEELKGDNTVGSLIALDDVPADAAVSVWAPGGERIGVFKVTLDLEKCLLVVRVAELSGRE